MLELCFVGFGEKDYLIKKFASEFAKINILNRRLNNVQCASVRANFLSSVYLIWISKANGMLSTHIAFGFSQSTF